MTASSHGNGHDNSSAAPDRRAGLAAALAQVEIYSVTAADALARREQWITYAATLGATEKQIEAAKEARRVAA